MCGGRVLEEVSGAAASEAAGGDAWPRPLRARTLLLAHGAPMPRNVRPERTLRASPEVLRKARGAHLAAR